MSTDHWDAEKIYERDSEEYAYLKFMNNVLLQAESMTASLKHVIDVECVKVEENQEKQRFYFTVILAKLRELQNVIPELPLEK